MDNHVHFVAVPEREDSLSVLFRRVHGRYAQVVNAQRLRSGHLWQNRFYLCALSPAHLRRALAYVERNPVRAALVERPEEYKWSSAAAHLGLANDRYSLLDKNFWVANGGAEGWAELLATPEYPLDTCLLRCCTYADRPFGGASKSRCLKSSFSGSGEMGLRERASIPDFRKLRRIPGRPRARNSKSSEGVRAVCGFGQNREPFVSGCWVP